MGELRRVDELARKLADMVFKGAPGDADDLAREYWAELDKEPERNEEGKPWNNN